MLLAALACHGESRGSHGDSAAGPVASSPNGPTVLASVAAPAVSSALRPLEPGALAGARLLLDKADGQEDLRVRARMAAGILEELEERRVPPRIVAALMAASERRVEVAQRAKIVWDAIAHTPSMLDAWNRACDAGPFDDGGHIVAVVAATAVSARQRAATVFGLCRLERAGLIELAELSLDDDLVVLAHALHVFLGQGASAPTGSPGSVTPEERRALVLLAQGRGRPAKVFEAQELPAVAEAKRLPGPAAEALDKRMRAGVALLRRGATKAFFEQMVHPHELGGLRLEAAADSFRRSGKSKALREALALAVGRVPVDDGEGEASIRLPWRPQPEARERLRFQLHRGAWFLRL